MRRRNRNRSGNDTALNPNMHPDRLVVLTLFCLHVSQAFSQWARPGSGSGVLKERKKRQQCTDGSYTHDSVTCCLCGAGNHLKEHCTSSSPRKCELCRPGTFLPHPNFLSQCEPCTSCSAENANLEEAELCTPSSDAVCRCKSGHYCSSLTEGICRICSSCQECGESGVRLACTATNDTVCNDKIQGGVNPAVIVVPVLLLLLCAVATVVTIFIYRRRKSSKSRQITKQATNGDANDLEMQLIKDMDITPHLSDIAQELEWGDMKKIALRSNMAVAIDNCERNHPGNTEEQTLELLHTWVQAEGNGAPRKLIASLRHSKKVKTAEKIEAILSGT